MRKVSFPTVAFACLVWFVCWLIIMNEQLLETMQDEILQLQSDTLCPKELFFSNWRSSRAAVERIRWRRIHLGSGIRRLL